MQDRHASPGSAGKSLTAQAFHPLTRSSLQARVRAVGRPVLSAKTGFACQPRGAIAGTSASNPGGVRPTRPAPVPDSPGSRDHSAVAPVASVGASPAGTPPKRSTFAWGFATADGRTRRSQRTVCSPWIGLFAENHPVSVHHSGATEKSTTATAAAYSTCWVNLLSERRISFRERRGQR